MSNSRRRGPASSARPHGGRGGAQARAPGCAALPVSRPGRNAATYVQRKGGRSLPYPLRPTKGVGSCPTPYVQLTSNRSPVGGLPAVPAATPSPDNERARRRAPRRARGEPAGPVEVERRRVPGFRRVRGFGRYPLVASGLTIAHDSRFCSPHHSFSAAAPVSVAAYRREAGRLRIVTSTLTTRQPTEP